ncbi:MAG: L,D-transpeptidase family protein [Actinobacteria bacterium]|nr:L,D-transpeptidase family protein [Actinomycetota bacterium]
MLHAHATPATDISTHRARRLPRLRAAVAAGLTTTVLLTGCGGASERITTTATPQPDVAVSEPAIVTAASDAPALAARTDGEVDVYDAPQNATPARTLPATTGFGTPTVLLVSEVGTGANDGWLEVLLPLRPNGSTGWIQAADVELQDLALQVEVNLQDKELVVRDGADEVLWTAAAIGDPDHPTPTGRFYIVDKLQSPNPGGVYGSFALGLSAHSDVAQDTLLVAWQQLDRLQQRGSFGGWVLRITRNRALDRLAHERRAVPTGDDEQLEPAVNGDDRTGPATGAPDPAAARRRPLG